MNHTPVGLPLSAGQWLARESLLPFTLWTRPDYQVGHPHRIFTAHLDRLVTGDLRRLLVLLPPRHGKSELVSRRLPCFFLGHYPDRYVIACSYSAALASRLNRDCQRIIAGSAYRQMFPDVSLGRCSLYGPRPSRTRDFFELAGQAGSYRSAGVGGSITGMGADLLILDDPIKNFDEAHSTAWRDRVDEWYTSTFWTRHAPDVRILITMTRWHTDDIAGRLENLDPWNAQTDLREFLTNFANNIAPAST